VSTKHAIGMDIGHSTVKLSFRLGKEVRQIIFPSVARPAFTINDDETARQAARETVDVGGVPYFFGQTALFQSAGQVVSGLVDDWIERPEHTALISGAIKKLEDAGVVMKDSVLCMGLPTNLASKYRDRLKAIVNKLVEVDTILVMPQSHAPLYTMVFDQEGFGIDGGNKLRDEAWGVIEVGYYTTDFMIIDKGQFFQGAEGACKGVHVASQRLHRTLADRGVDCSLMDAEEMLRTKRMKDMGRVVDLSKEVEDSVNEIVTLVEDESNRLMKDKVRRLDGILVAGGGAPLVIEKFTEKWPHSVLSENPRFSVSEGMRRFGEADLRRRGFAVQGKKAAATEVEAV